MKTIVISTLLLFSIQAMSTQLSESQQIAHTLQLRGKEVGNGGDVVVCKDPQGKTTSIEMFDLYEGRTLRGIQPSFPTGANEWEILTSLIKRIELVNPTRAGRYLESLEFFKKVKNVLYVPNAKLIDIPDSGAGFIPNGCQLEQLAVQQVPLLEDEPTVIVSKDLYDLMSNEQRAALWLHEIILAEAVRVAGQKNSIGARYINSLIFGDLVFETQNWMKATYISGFTLFEYNGVEFYSKVNPLASDWGFAVNDFNTKFEFFSSRELYRVKEASPYSFTNASFDFSNDEQAEITWQINGHLESISLIKDIPLDIRYDDKKVLINGLVSKIEFDESGMISSLEYYTNQATQADRGSFSIGSLNGKARAFQVPRTRLEFMFGTLVAAHDLNSGSFNSKYGYLFFASEVTFHSNGAPYETWLAHEDVNKLTKISLAAGDLSFRVAEARFSSDGNLSSLSYSRNTFKLKKANGKVVKCASTNDKPITAEFDAQGYLIQCK